MRILLVIDGLGPGGAQRQLVTLALGLQSRGHQVEVFIYYPEYHFRDLLDGAGIAIHLNCKKSRFSINPILALVSLLRSSKFDVMLAFLQTPSLYAEIASLFWRETKVVVSERSRYPLNRLGIRLWLLQQVHRLADRVTVNSFHQGNLMRQQFPWMSARLSVIWNGYDLSTFAPSNRDSPPNHRLKLLAIASVARMKNSLNLAKAIKLCGERYGLTVDVDWAGAQSVSGDGDAAWVETNSYLAKNNLLDRWTWLGVRSDIRELLASSDALIHPSLLEGLPNTVCEALACGRPVLASRVCDHPLLVQDAVSGYLFDPESPEDIARVIRTFDLSTPTQRQLMGESARRFAEDHLSLVRLLDQYEALMVSLSCQTIRGVN